MLFGDFSLTACSRRASIAVLGPLGSLGHRSKGIDNHHAGARRFDFLNDAPQQLLQRAVDHVLAQIDVADRLGHAGDIEEGELLLIAELPALNDGRSKVGGGLDFEAGVFAVESIVETGADRAGGHQVHPHRRARRVR